MQMKPYKKIIHKLGYSKAARLCDERVAALFVSVKSPADWYGFPPALLPIMSDGTWPAYIGLWKHWFVSRSPSFVELNIADDYRLDEISRTDIQIAFLMILRLIVLKDDVDEDVHWLAEHLGVSEEDLSRLDAFSQEHGDDPDKIRKLHEFWAMTPAEFCKDSEYDGEFSSRSAAALSGIEFDIDKAVECADERPWLSRDSDKPQLFSDYMDRADFGRAWLTLNSRGWSFAAAAQALERLKDNASDPDFVEICDLWITYASKYEGAY